MKISGNEIKPGMIIEYNNDLWEVTKTQHVKPGKGGAFNQIELKSINKNIKRNERFRSSDNVEKVILEEKKFNFIFEDNKDCHFMDQTTFEQIAINKTMIGEKAKLLKENLEVTINFFEERALSVELPISIACKVTSTDATLKGQTVSSSYKPAIVNKYLNILVPPFIENDDEIIVDSRSLEYIKKVKR
jgi:elongation factor P